MVRSLPMSSPARPHAGARGRIAPVIRIIASMLAMAIVFAFVVGTTVGLDTLRLPADSGPIGAAVEAGGIDSLPFGKLAEETVGEESGDEKSEKDDLDDAALGHIDFQGLVLGPRSVSQWERPSSSRARALLGVIGARGPPIG